MNHQDWKPVVLSKSNRPGKGASGAAKSQSLASAQRSGNLTRYVGLLVVIVGRIEVINLNFLIFRVLLCWTFWKGWFHFFSKRLGVTRRLERTERWMGYGVVSDRMVVRGTTVSSLSDLTHSHIIFFSAEFYRFV